MVRPTRNAVEPRFKKRKLAVPKLRCNLLEQQHCENSFFQHAAPKQLIGDLYKKIFPHVPRNRLPEAVCHFAHLGRAPPARLNFVFKELLNALGVRRRTTIFQNTANVVGDVSGCDFALWHGSATAHDNRKRTRCAVRLPSGAFPQPAMRYLHYQTLPPAVLLCRKSKVGPLWRRPIQQ